MRELLRRLDDALSTGGERIVCQVVETKGSTPQKAGALMVVDPDGGQLGTLGGGCVENEGGRGGVACVPTLWGVRLAGGGAGDVARAGASVAARAAFDLWVADDRHECTDREWVPEADGLVVGPLDVILPELEVDERTYAVIV